MIFEHTLSKKQSHFNPELVSFRELVPEITSTHFVYYYPAKFIPQVVRYCIDNYTQQNDWIIDPFAGSGTTCLAAKNLKRHYLGIEINPEYVNLAKKRLEEAGFAQELFV